MIKAIVVDDEKLVRKGFISMIDWAAYGIVIVGEAGDGHAALELLAQCEADLLFTDITMPGLSGFDLIKQVRQRYSRMQSVVLTCHHEFDYVQEALRLGSIDYIVKTLLDLDNLDEVLNRIVERMRWEASSRYVYGGGDTPREERLNVSSALLFCPLTHHEDSSELYRLSLVQSHPLIDIGGIWMVPMAHSQAPDAWKRELDSTISGNWQVAMVTGLSNKPIDEMKRTIVAKLSKHLFYTITSPTEIATATYEELAAIKDSTQSDIDDAIEFALSCKWTLYSEDWDTFIRKMLHLRPEPARIAAFAASLRRDWGKLLGLEEADALFLSLSTPARTRTWGGWKNEFRRFSDIVQRRMVELSLSKDVMLSLIRAVQYMKQESGNKINQTDVSRHINMSRSYFSQCFAKFAGESFGEMLRHIRIERAKSLLAETELPVYEVATMAGFEDDKYFSRIFRDRVGKLPSEYRAEGRKTV